MSVNQAKSQILFVDDEQRVLNSMRVMFRRDYQLHLTTSGPEALEIIARHQIDVIVADMRMPEMSGVEVLSAVKHRSPKTVRILLTGYADLDAIEGSINESEVFRFLTKPCAPEELRQTIREAATIAREDVLSEALVEPLVEPPLEDAEELEPQPTLVQDAVRYSEPAPPPAPADTFELTLEEEPQPRAVVAHHDIPVLEDRAVPVPASRSARSRPRAAGPATAAAILAAPPAEHREPADDEPTNVFGDEESAQTIIMEGHSVRVVDNTSPGDRAPAAGRATSRRPRREEVAVVVFSGDKQLLSVVREALANRHHVVHASNIVNVIKLLESYRPGVMITDVSEDARVIERMTATLKEHLPELVTIVVGEHRDTVELVNLINHGQIFRFVRKPMSAELCLRNVQAATAKHLLFCRYPDLLKRHSIRAIADEERGRFAETFGSFIDRLRNMRKKWHSSQATH